MALHRRHIVIALATVLMGGAVAGRGRAITWLTTERASWRYVDDAWGGLQVSAAYIRNDRVWLRVRTYVHPTRQMDSAICVRRASVRFKEGRIILRLYKAVCNPSLQRPVEASLKAPVAGMYDVVYDDQAAGFPRLGQVEIP